VGAQDSLKPYPDEKVICDQHRQACESFTMRWFESRSLVHEAALRHDPLSNAQAPCPQFISNPPSMTKS
jgi:hypothetical protein